MLCILFSNTFGSNYIKIDLYCSLTDIWMQVIEPFLIYMVLRHETYTTQSVITYVNADN